MDNPIDEGPGDEKFSGDECESDGPRLRDLIGMDDPWSALDDPDTDTSADDEYPDEQEQLDLQGIEIDGAKWVSSEGIPLGVVGDLVWGWRLDEKNGNWSMATLTGCGRREGTGNRSWFVSTLDPEDGRVRVWRVSRGGQGKKLPTATEVEIA